MGTVSLRTAEIDSLTVHPLSHELFGQLPPDEFESLKVDIANRGLQYPPEVDRWQRIICGSQRFRAAQELGWTHLEVFDRTELETEDQVREHLIRDNLHRRHLSPLTRYRAAEALEEIVARQAHERQTAELQRGQDICKSPLGTVVPNGVATDEQGRTQDNVAKEVGWSGETFRRMKKVVESGDEDLIAKVDKGELGIATAAQMVHPRHQAQELDPEDRRSPALRLAKWEFKMEKFLIFIEAHPALEFAPLEHVMRERLQRAEDRLRAVREQ